MRILYARCPRGHRNETGLRLASRGVVRTVETHERVLAHGKRVELRCGRCGVAFQAGRADLSTRLGRHPEEERS